MVRFDWKMALVLAAAAGVCAVAGCNGSQRDSALRAVRSMQQSGTAQAAMLPDSAPTQANPPGGPPPAAPPPGGKPGGPPPPGGNPPATPPPGGAPPAGKTPDGKTPDGKAPAGAPVKPGAAAPGAKDDKAAKSPDQIVKDFVDSDPRDILTEKSNLLKEKETKPWDTNNPDTFVPETGRKDPLTVVRSSIPSELLPQRSGNDDNSELVTFLLTQAATDLMAQLTKRLVCYSVIQIGLQKYARISWDGGKTIQTVSESSQVGSSFATDQGGLNLSMTVASISADEVDLDVTVSGSDTNVNVEKMMVFIPRSYQ